MTRGGWLVPGIACRVSLLSAALLLTSTSVSRSGEPGPIPREKFFAESSRDAAMISPDGAKLAFLVRSESGALNLVVSPIPKGWNGDALDLQSPRVVLDDREAGFGGLSWSPDSRGFFFFRDRDGDENLHLFHVDAASREIRDLTPFEQIRAQNLMVDPKSPDELLVGLNLRDKTVFDMHRIHLRTGEVTLDTQNPGDVVSWVTDRDFRIRACTALDLETGDTILRVRDDATSPWRQFQRWGFDDAGSDLARKILAFTPDGRGLFLQSALGSNTMRIVRMSLDDSTRVEVLSEDPVADVWNFFGVDHEMEAAVHWASDGSGPAAVAFNGERPGWDVLRTPAGDAIRGDFARLAEVHSGVFIVASSDSADTRWIVSYFDDRNPGVFYLYDRGSRRASLLFETTPELADLPLAPMLPIKFAARDGMSIHGYLTYPPGTKLRARAPGTRGSPGDGPNLPLILHPHGGPWLRDDWGYNAVVQWLANRGYAVLQVNFRGSSGWGKQYLSAGDGEMGTGHMQHDLTDAVRWAIAGGIADSTRIAIFGGSYGGYAALAGLAFTPDLYACGVAMVAPSDVASLIESFPPYWATRRKRWLRRIGDVIADPALNQRISPLYHVDAIRAPLLIAHGANDPRVKQAHSDRIVAALRARDLPVEYIVYPDEGHGWARAENDFDFYGRAEEFLGRHLGGRVEPWREVPGSSAEVR